MPVLSKADFADLFGTTVDGFDTETIERIESHDWTYEPLVGSERDAVILDLFDRVATRRLTTVANEDKSRWVKGWGENLEALKEKDGDTEALIPKYIRPGQPLRLYGEFVKSRDPHFEYNWFSVFSEWFFRKHFSTYDHIFEFGCGSGINVANLAKMFPEKTIHGLDWAHPSVEIVDSLRTMRGMRTEGHHFDFFHPDENITFPVNATVFTLGALEQTGTNWNDFLDFLLRKQPARVHHIEPFYEWYDSASLVDYTAWKAHETRNFWRGFPQKMRELEAQGKVRILKTKRAYMGSVVLEGYSQFIWEPII